MITRKKPDGTLEVLCCPMTDRTGQAGIAKPDVVGCGSPNIRLDKGVYDCLDCGIDFESDKGEWHPLLDVQVTPQELGTILAALRFWQKHGPKQKDSFFDRIEMDEQDALNAIRTNGGEFPTDLGIENIDSLCERINNGNVLGEDAMYCDQCGKEFEIDGTGVANHMDDDGEIDHDADADHIPYHNEE